MQYTTPLEKLKTFDHIINIWKQNVCLFLIPRKQDHVCIPFEDRHRKVCKIEKDGKFLTDEFKRKQDACNIENISAAIYKNSLNGIHICITGYCCMKEDKSIHLKLIEWIDDIFYCHTGGIEHYCGQFCKLSNELNKDREYVCKISGKTTGKVEIVPDIMDKFRAEQRQNNVEEQNDTNEIENENVFQETKKKKKKNDLINPKDLDLIIHNAMNGQKSMINTKFINKKMIKASYLAIAVDLIASSFVREKEKSRDGFNTSKEEKELMELFHKYIHKKNQVSQLNDEKLPNVIDLEMIANKYRQKRPLGIDISRLNSVQIKTISIFYATKCLALWYVLKTKTDQGKETKQSNQWKEFIRSSMCIFQEGIRITPIDTRDEKLEILEPDPFLSYLKGSLDMNFSSGRLEKKSKKNGHTKINSSCIKHILRAIKDDGLSPHEFSLGDITFEDMDEKHFDRLNILQ